MKRNHWIKGALAGLLVVASWGASAQEKGALTIHIEGLRNNNGTVMVALTEKEMPTDMNFVGADMAKADSTGMKFFFEELPAMTVYVQVFHDENRNYQLDMTPDGKMKEGVGIIPGGGGIPRPSATVTAGENTETRIALYYFE